MIRNNQFFKSWHARLFSIIFFCMVKKIAQYVMSIKFLFLQTETHLILKNASKIINFQTDLIPHSLIFITFRWMCALNKWNRHSLSLINNKQEEITQRLKNWKVDHKNLIYLFIKCWFLANNYQFPSHHHDEIPNNLWFPRFNTVTNKFRSFSR